MTVHFYHPTAGKIRGRLDSTAKSEALSMKSTLCEDAITAMVYPYAQGILGARNRDATRNILGNLVWTRKPSTTGEGDINEVVADVGDAARPGVAFNPIAASKLCSEYWKEPRTLSPAECDLTASSQQVLSASAPITQTYLSRENVAAEKRESHGRSNPSRAAGATVARPGHGTLPLQQSGCRKGRRILDSRDPDGADAPMLTNLQATTAHHVTIGRRLIMDYGGGGRRNKTKSGGGRDDTSVGF
ncbi:hypothetical protein PCL_00881 [Purpureocillium lilacinum]|uniref:Uncharacterized protein n=1 Tax=Purpureocillium lilacinum TaxID=33203 RepID=A0A2U3E438_PURLI|nr:hypothetical protein PCL_00881 [Purpureocillium lilacinum]